MAPKKKTPKTPKASLCTKKQKIVFKEALIKDVKQELNEALWNNKLTDYTRPIWRHNTWKSIARVIKCPDWPTG